MIWLEHSASDHLRQVICKEMAQWLKGPAFMWPACTEHVLAAVLFWDPSTPWEYVLQGNKPMVLENHNWNEWPLRITAMKDTKHSVEEFDPWDSSGATQRPLPGQEECQPLSYSCSWNPNGRDRKKIICCSVKFIYLLHNWILYFIENTSKFRKRYILNRNYFKMSLFKMNSILEFPFKNDSGLIYVLT